MLLSGPVVAGLCWAPTCGTAHTPCGPSTQRADQLERERDQQATFAAAEERTRIAREMHDIVAHSLSVMVTLSEGAALKQTTEPERADPAMRQVSADGHQALDEMRRLLGVLRTEDAPESCQPLPGLAQLDELFDQVRATGLAAGPTVTGTPVAMLPGAELTVYRIVQEALTNTLKHAASPTRVEVAIACRPGSVTVDVHDDGARPARPESGADGRSRRARATGTGCPARAGGHGLVGMRERACCLRRHGERWPGPRLWLWLSRPACPWYQHACGGRAAPVSIRLLLADDQPLIRAGFRMILEEAGGIDIVGEAQDGAEAVRLAGELKPDVILMDVRMPGPTASRPPGRSWPATGRRGCSS